MKVFISWSGEASRELAISLSEWFPKVLQGIQPFVSAKDIDKGAQWTQVLASELSDSDFGVLCLTPANLLSPWLNYEAGAIMSSVDSRVCPVLLGVEKGAVRPPLSQLQMTSIDVQEFALLMNSMNKAAGSSLDQSAVNEAVRVWWPQLEDKIKLIETPTPPEEPQKPTEPPKPESTTDEVMREILMRLRRIERRAVLDAHARVRPPGISGYDPIVSVVLRDLRRIGFEAIPLSFEDQNLELVCQELPDPLPRLVDLSLSERSAELGITIRLRAGGDRAVTFRNGGSDNPPF